LKPEARILASACTTNACLALILRGIDVDGAVAASSCKDLCRRLEAKGFMGELRYAVGDCSCGLPEPPRKEGISRVLEAARRALEGAQA